MISEQPEATAGGSRRDRLEQAHAQAHRDFDRAVMTLSAGALGLTIAFVKDIAGPHPTHVPALGVAWAMLALSLLTIMFSFLTSQKALLLEIDAEDRNDHSVYRGDAFGRWTLRMNLAAAVLLVGGAGAFMVFAYQNLNP